MSQKVLIVHAEGEDERAEELAAPIRDAGYDVWHQGLVLTGESITEESSKALSTGAPVILCGTERTMARGYAHRFINAARARNSRVSVFPVRMEQHAYVEALSYDAAVAEYWQDKGEALSALITSLRKHYPQSGTLTYTPSASNLENKYRKLALASFDIIDLDNLPDVDRDMLGKRIDLRRLYVTLRVRDETSSNTEKDVDAARAAEKPAMEAELLRNKEKEKQKGVPIGRELNNARQLVVLGEAGSGKTTMLRWIATACLLRISKEEGWADFPDMETLPKEEWLPIIIRCRELNISNIPSPSEDLIRQTLLRLEIPSDEVEALLTVIKGKLERGEALLLIDGLDEITDPAMRADFCKQIEIINAAYQRAPIVVTSRAAGYREMGCRIGRGFKHLIVSDLSDEDKDYFARQWCAITALPGEKEKATKELIEEIHGTDRIERLTRNPMLLTTMALVKRRGGKLPGNRVDLYWAALDVLLNWRSRVDKPLDWREAGPQLEYLAFTMCERGVQQLREDEILTIFESLRENFPSLYTVQEHTPGEFLRLLERRTGILVHAGSISFRGRTVKLYEFRHLTFQEYLAALALVEGYYPTQLGVTCLADAIAPLAGRTIEEKPGIGAGSESVVTENWREAIRLCVTICDYHEVDSLFRAILHPLEGEDPHITSRPRAVLAALCLADEPNGVSKDVVSEVLSAIIKIIDDSDGISFDDDFGRPQRPPKTSLDTAIQELARSRWAGDASRLLVAEFRSRNASSRWGVGCLAGAVGSPSLKDFSETAAWCIEQRSKIISKDENKAIGSALAIRSALSTVYLNPTLELLNGLFDMLTWDAPSAHAAASALNKLNDDNGQYTWRPRYSDVGYCVSLLNNPSYDVGAVTHLAAILGREGDERAVDPLIKRLSDSDITNRQVVVEALGNIGDARAVMPLLSLLDDEDPAVRKAAVKSLGLLQDVRAVDALIKQLNDDDMSVRKEVLNSLPVFKGEKVEEVLIAKLDDNAVEMRAAAMSSLNRIDPKRFVEYAIARVDDESSALRRIAIPIIARSEDARAEGIVIAATNDRDAEVRTIAVMGLGIMNSPAAINTVVNKLDDDLDEVSFAAAYTLAYIAKHNLVEPFISTLLQKMDERREYISATIAEALKKIESDEKIEPLLGRLKDKNKKICSAAIKALSKSKRDDVFKAIIDKLGDESDDVRESASEALGMLGDQRAVESLLLRLEDESLNVVVEAVEALGKLGDESAVDPLLAKLNHNIPGVRIAVIKAMKDLKDPRALAPLLLVLDDPNAQMRRLAIQALGALEGAAIEQPLLDKLEDESRDVRAEIVDLLATREGGDIKEALVARLKDTNAAIRSPARSALLSRGIGKFELGDIAETAAIFEEIVDAMPDSNDVRNNLIFCYLLLGSHEAASRHVALLDFNKNLNRRPLWQNNRGLLTFLMGDMETAITQLKTALDWIEAAGAQYDPRDVHSVLLLNKRQSVSSFQDIPIDAAILINLYLMGEGVIEKVSSDLSERYPVEYEGWLILIAQLDEQRTEYVN